MPLQFEPGERQTSYGRFILRHSFKGTRLRNKRILLAGLTVSMGLAVPFSSSLGQESVYERRVYRTARATPSPPVIDGDLGDECWNAVEWGTDFTQWEPEEGAPPSQQTAFKILYDDRALYVAYRVFDTANDRRPGPPPRGPGEDRL